jgi:3-methyladenine DNA glycosylase/8-oxoguanine DNA glycosylase
LDLLKNIVRIVATICRQRRPVEHAFRSCNRFVSIEGNRIYQGKDGIDRTLLLENGRFFPV